MAKVPLTGGSYSIKNPAAIKSSSVRSQNGETIFDVEYENGITLKTTMKADGSISIHTNASANLDPDTGAITLSL
ncbi:hypothetical protein FACS1894137_07110 [Spirochaetia bacterium]|nr:hypothetical protein FACS1894137_07110 [Spirochaetia bacterium]